MHKKTLVLDFDGVIHGYQSGWQGIGTIPDPPVGGAMIALQKYTEDPEIQVAILSSRSRDPVGLNAMQTWLEIELHRALDSEIAKRTFAAIQWPTEKPAAWVLLDDRAWCFRGEFPAASKIKEFQPWYKEQP